MYLCIPWNITSVSGPRPARRVMIEMEMTHYGPQHPMLSCVDCCLTFAFHFPQEESVMPPKRLSPDADNVLRQPLRKVSARRASSPDPLEHVCGLRHIPPDAIVLGGEVNHLSQHRAQPSQCGPQTRSMKQLHRVLSDQTQL